MSKQHSNTIPPTVWQFLWQVIKPYRWWYVLMLQAPALTAFYIFANNYSFKLLVDAFSINAPIQYSNWYFQLLYSLRHKLRWTSFDGLVILQNGNASLLLVASY